MNTNSPPAGQPDNAYVSGFSLQQVVPEPSSVALMLIALGAMAFVGGRRVLAGGPKRCASRRELFALVLGQGKPSIGPQYEPSESSRRR